MASDGLREEELESRWEAAPAVAVVIALQVLLAVASRQQDWQLWIFSWWVWLVPVAPEVLLLVPLAWQRRRRELEQQGRRRAVSIGLIGTVSAANFVLLTAVIASLIRGNETSGSQLLLKGIAVWTTNVIAFGLWFWEFDRGGPVSRLRPEPPLPDFLFPQLDDKELAPRGWRPELVDYLYVSYTNSIAFSPTDVMPLSRWAKLLMLAESSLSSITVLLVAARAVNIFK